MRDTNIIQSLAEVKKVSVMWKNTFSVPFSFEISCVRHWFSNYITVAPNYYGRGDEW